MAVPLNQDIGGRLDEVAALLTEQGANRFRVQAYHHAADAVRVLAEPVSAIFERDGLAGLQEIPAVGPSIARAIRDLLLHGRLAMLDRLRGEHDPIALLRTVPGIGKSLAWTLHDDLGLDSLADLEAAAHDGRLENLAGLGAKRLAGIRDSLAHRLGRTRPPAPTATITVNPAVAEILGVDNEYRRGVAANRLQKITPRRMNPKHEAWLPVLHTSRGARHYTALFSNTPRAHEAGRTRDWVVIYHDGPDGERQCTVITAQFGKLKGRRIIRGREAECEAHYRSLGAGSPLEQPFQLQLASAS
jgi:DNA polymerase (family 10)